MPATIPYLVLQAAQQGLRSFSGAPPPGIVHQIVKASNADQDTWAELGQSHWYLAVTVWLVRLIPAKFLPSQIITLVRGRLQEVTVLSMFGETLLGSLELQVPIEQALYAVVGFLDREAGGAALWIDDLLNPLATEILAIVELLESNDPSPEIQWALANHREYIADRATAWVVPVEGRFSGDFATHGVLTAIRQKQKTETEANDDMEENMAESKPFPFPLDPSLLRLTHTLTGLIAADRERSLPTTATATCPRQSPGSPLVSPHLLDPIPSSPPRHLATPPRSAQPETRTPLRDLALTSLGNSPGIPARPVPPPTLASPGKQRASRSRTTTASSVEEGEIVD
ncbi:hypothetical protein FB451DRAFT_1567053 [Mycena latifolia]|nr:hypothetical protein FB451DRAFT_1567053 [Mycena latifolia]